MWLSLIIPIIAIIILIGFFSKNLTIWEVPLPLVFSILFVLIVNLFAKTLTSYETEYLGTFVDHFEHYEDWDEMVKKTRTEKKSVKQADGSYKDESYEVVYYELEYHAEYYTMNSKAGHYEYISKEEYQQYVKHFGTKPVFVDLYRDYENIDGDKYVCTWSGDKKTHIPYIYTNSYVNKVRNSDINLLNMSRIHDSIAVKKGLYKYPSLKSPQTYLSVLSKYSYPYLNKEVTYLNAKLGKEKQVRVWFLIFDNAPYSIINDQENYWVRGNKNEVVIIASRNKLGKFDWVGGFSWSKLNFNDIQRDILGLNNHADSELAKYVETKLFDYIKSNFKRKEFKDFDYLEVEIGNGTVIFTWIFVLLITIGTCIWVANNEFY